jgi:tripartite-type tricarboxylate transporter receptor subunit TctC
MQPISHWAAVIAWAVLTLPTSPARAQDYPTRAVTIVAPSAPGGMYSILARLIGGKLERLYGKSFVVENRPGASSVTGAVAVMRAPPDGYTLMVATSSTLATNVTLHKNLPYDPLVDFVPITLIALSPEVLLINHRFRFIRSRTWSSLRARHLAACHSARPDLEPRSTSMANSSKPRSASRCTTFPTKGFSPRSTILPAATSP